MAIFGTVVPGETFGFRNRIINGDMRIDQRNAGASVTITTDTTYTVDRFYGRTSQASKYSVQQSTDAPDGFTNSVLITSLSAYSITAGDYFTFEQRVEGYNIADLMWGSASAKTITLSFWVKSSLTGTFSGIIRTANSYAFTYTINSADTWEYKTVTIPGDEISTTNTTNGVGLQMRFSLGAGETYLGTAGSWVTSANYFGVTGQTNLVSTNGATLRITGVQLEVGSVATPFERRPFGTELALCQRYFMRDSSLVVWMYLAHAVGSNFTRTTVFLPTTMRANPTVSVVMSGPAAGGIQGITPNMFTPFNNAQTESAHIDNYTASAEL